MKSPEQIVQMQEDLRLAMATVQESGAPPQIIKQSALALASAHDTINWVLERPSTLGELEAEYNKRREELEHTKN